MLVAVTKFVADKECDDLSDDPAFATYMRKSAELKQLHDCGSKSGQSDGSSKSGITDINKDSFLSKLSVLHS